MSDNLRRSHRVFAVLLDWLVVLGIMSLVFRLVPPPIFFGPIIFIGSVIVAFGVVILAYFKLLKLVAGTTAGPVIVRYLIKLWGRVRRG